MKIADLEKLIDEGKVVAIAPDGEVSVSDRPHRPTIDQVLAQIGDEHNRPVEPAQAESCTRSTSGMIWKRLSEETPSRRGIYLCRLVGQHVSGGIEYRGLLWDDGFYGGGAATISHWTEIEEVKA